VGYGGALWGQPIETLTEVGVQPMFLGTHTPRLDDKGRLALPAKFRSELESGLVITKGQERCLFVFPVTEFNRLTELLRTAPVTDRRVRDYSRVFFASASHEVPDGQGRITVPQPLRHYAGLTKDSVVIGANTRVEVWDANAWQEYLDNTEQTFADAAEEVLPGLL
jgi:MraZ protein